MDVIVQIHSKLIKRYVKGFDQYEPIRWIVNHPKKNVRNNFRKRVDIMPNLL